MCIPQELFGYGNITTKDDAPPLLAKMMFVVVGARVFSPGITVHIIGAEVP